MKILLVEDSNTDAALIRHALEPTGAPVERVTNLAAARERIRATDLMILDLDLPDSDHVATLAWLDRTLAAGGPRAGRPVVLVFTGLVDAGLAELAGEAGADAALRKDTLQNGQAAEILQRIHGWTLGRRTRRERQKNELRETWRGNEWSPPPSKGSTCPPTSSWLASWCRFL